jgi:DNA-binding NarL/FixJ family response regulator
MNHQKLRIFLADDHALVRAGLKSLLEKEPDITVVGEAADGEAAWQQAADLQPDVAVIDISMPECGGAEVAARLRCACPTTRTLALTAHEDEETLRELLQAGAAGYLLKRSVAEELTRAIRTVAAGGLYIDPLLAPHLVDRYIQPAAAPTEPPAEPLSPRETEVLRYLAWGYTNQEVADQLAISVKTIETHKARLMAKLDLHSRVDLVRYALHRGWLQPK